MPDNHDFYFMLSGICYLVELSVCSRGRDYCCMLFCISFTAFAILIKSSKLPAS